MQTMKTRVNKQVMQTPKRRRARAKRALSSAPVSLGVTASVPSPVLKTVGGSVIVRNRETILELVSSATSGTDVTGRLALSAWNPSVLPWLANIGPLYSKYRVLALDVIYEPYCPTTIGGEVAAVLVYDENDSSVITPQTILQTQGNQRCPVWGPSAPVKYDKARAAYPWLYCKFNPAATTVANLSVAAWLIYSYFSSAESTRLGRFMCEYIVELTDPISPNLNG